MELAKKSQAAKITLYSLLQAIREKEQGVILGFDPNLLHDFRVAIRRTRTALSSLKNVDPRDPSRILRKELAWLTRCSGASRDLDVFRIELSNYLNNRPRIARLQLSPLVNLLSHVRLVKHSSLVATMTSRRYFDLLDRWGKFVLRQISCPPETHTLPTSNTARSPLSTPSLFARERVAGAARRLLLCTPLPLTLQPIYELHRLRIRCKKLRYTLELFWPSLSLPGVDQQLSFLKQLQSCLGKINDIESQIKWIEILRTRLVDDNACLVGTGPATELLESQLVQEQAEHIAEVQVLIADFSSKENRIRLEKLINLPVGALIPYAT